MEFEGKYFYFIMRAQRPKLVMIPQTFFAASERAKRCMFLKPHPPKDLGDAIFYVHGRVPSLLLFG